jgi:hypothetical protein
MTSRRRVGIYFDAASVLRNPDYVPLLQERIGLNLVILGYDGSPPPKVLAHSPLDGPPVTTTPGGTNVAISPAHCSPTPNLSSAAPSPCGPSFCSNPAV